MILAKMSVLVCLWHLCMWAGQKIEDPEGLTWPVEFLDDQGRFKSANNVRGVQLYRVFEGVWFLPMRPTQGSHTHPLLPFFS